MPTHTATTRLAAIEKTVKRFRAKEARFGSTAVESILAVAGLGRSLSQRDVMMSLANCCCGAAPRWEGLIEISGPC